MATTETKSNSQTTGPPLLADRVAIVTGASGGIGAASARAFASTGAAVLPAARDAEDLDSVVHEIAAQGGQALGVPADVTGADAVRRVVETFGGSTPPSTTLAGTFDRRAWRGVPGGVRRCALDVNLPRRVPLGEVRDPGDARLGGGAIVNVSSTAGLSAGAPGLSAYTSAKHGLQGLTKVAALDYAERGVRVNAVAPGPILADPLAALGNEPQRMAAQAVPMRRLGRPEEVLAAAVWLCSDQAAFITGATLAIDGGQQAGTA